MFRIIGKAEIIEGSINTSHIRKRANRVALVNRLIAKENAIAIDAYVVDKEHENGYERHVIYNNGCVKVYNNQTQKYVTCLVARLPQIERYGIEPTKTMREKIKRHIELGYNEVY